MGLLQATAMVVGIIIGASIFVQPSEVSRHVPSPGGVLAVWLVAGLLTLCGALVCAEFSRRYPQTGGVYVYLRESVSPLAGFLWGWAMFWSVHSGIIAAIAVVFARYTSYFTPLDDTGIRGVAIGAILLLSFVNYIGVRAGGAVQTIITAAKLGAIALMLGMAVALPRPASAASVAQPFGTGDFLLGVGAGLFAYGGWHMVTYAAGETRDPERTIPRALAIGTLLVTACYMALNAAYLWILPLDQVLASTRVAADAAQVLVGPTGAGFVSGLVIVSAFGALNGVILAGPRLYLAMAEDRLWFRRMASIHRRYQSPHVAIFAQAAWASVLVASGSYRALYSRVVYTEWLFFGLMAWGFLRVRGSGSRAAAMASYLFIPACAWIVATHISAEPMSSLLGLLLVIAGLPVYYFWKRHADR